MKQLLIILALIGLVAPYSQFLPLVLDNGLDIALFIEQILNSQVSAGAWLDVMVSALTLFAMLFYARQSLKLLDMIIIGLGTLLAGVSLGLPLFFYLMVHRDVLKM